MVKKMILLAVFVFVTARLAFPQMINKTFERITRKDGLSQSTVNYIIQDKKGFMWFATFEGINRYDGFNFKVYTHTEEDKNSLSHNASVYLYEDNEGYIWVVNNANTGLDKFDPETEKFTHYKHDPEDSTSISSNQVYIVFQDKSGNIWVSTENALNLVVNEKIDNKTTTRFKRFYYTSNTNPFSMVYEDGNGKLLLFADYLYYFDRKDNKILKTDVEIPLYRIYSLVEDSSKNLWLASNAGILKLAYDKGTDSYKKAGLGKLNQIPISKYFATIDSKNRIWIGTEYDGLFLYDELENSVMKFENNKIDLSSISENSINSLFIDRSGVLWIGTSSMGLCKYDLYKKQFHHFKSIPGNENTLSGNVITSIHSTKPGELWVGNDLGGGINRFVFNDKFEPKVIHYKNNPNNPNSIANNKIISLVQRKNGEVWAGSKSNYISQIIPEKYGSNKPPLIKRKSIAWTFCIYEDSEEIVWGGTWGNGLWRYDEETGSFISYLNDPDNPSSLCDNVVWAITEDNSGNIWIGGHGKGLSILPAKEKYNPNPKFVNFKHEKGNNNSLSNNTVHVFYQSLEGTMWIGTSSGLNKVKGRDFGSIDASSKLEFYSYHIKDGLPSEGIIGIVEDNNSNLWLSTSNGLSKFNLSDSSFTNYYDSDGLQSNEFWHNAYFKDHNGMLYFGGQNGFNAFYPDSIKANPFIPQVVFTDIKLFNKSVNIDDTINNDIILSKSILETSEITLSHKNNIFTLEFVALHFSQPKQNKYAYIMEGFDEDWVETSADRRHVNYTNLPAGKYTFKVKASNSDGVWNEQGASLKIVILPPWWKTWWFRISLGIFVLIAFFAIYRIRVNALKQQKKELEHKVKIRTHDLQQANTELKMHQEEILAQNEEIHQQAEELTAQRDLLEEQNEEIKSKNEQVMKAFSNTRILSDFGQQITSTLKLGDINDMIYDYVSSLMDTSAFGIGVFNSDRDCIEYHGFMEKGKKVPHFWNNMDEENSLSVWCLKKRKEVIINDFNTDYKKYLPGLNKKQTKKIPLSSLYVPLSIGNKPIGVVTCQSYNKNAYQENDINYLLSLASYIAIALENANNYEIINKQNLHIKSSIEYAKTIQNSILPSETTIEKYFDPFIIYWPKDIVSGDFYWFYVANTTNDKELVFFAVVDCTGHGVPGAFMSLIGSRLLNEIVGQRKIFDPAQILDLLNIGIQLTLKQGESDNNDGMHVCLCRFEKQADSKTKLVFSGAKRPLILFKNENKQIERLDGARKSIGGIRAIKSKLQYTNKEIILGKGDTLYLTTDGYVDQNAPGRKKFGSKKMLEILESIKLESMEKQKQILEQESKTHRNNSEQRDDITFVGLRL